MEYEEAPSGFVTLYNYKEPFMRFEEGHGYQGVLLFDGDSDKVQCHFCGNWYHALGAHLHKEHNMKACDYKEATGLRQTTALISESLRDKLIASGLEKRMKNFKKNKFTHSEESKKKISESLKQHPRETQNERGTCPQQLIDRLIILSQKIGRCPTTKEVPFIQTLTKVYGNYTNACLVAGLNPLKPSHTLPKAPKYTQEQLVAIVKDFYVKNDRFPRFTDKIIVKHDWTKYLSKSMKDIKKKVLIELEKYQRTGIIIRYSKDELLQMIKIFQQKNERNPSVSDCKRGMLPHASRYYYHFGSLRNAVKLV